MGKFRIALYGRVSTTRDQSTDAQIHELRTYCAARDWIVTHELVDNGFSGGTDERPALKALMNLALKREIDCVVVLKLDRLFRSVSHLIKAIDDFQALGITLVAVRDAIDLTTSQGRLFASILGALAEFEKNLIRERTLIGLDHARRKGKKLGRPCVRDDKAILALRSQGLTYSQIQLKMGISRGAVVRAVQSGPKSVSKVRQKA